ncbi:MAG: hypothetical protein WCV90_09040 [Candidatus Woesearchaeota archaeon]|jgi:hypothetical protein
MGAIKNIFENIGSVFKSADSKVIKTTSKTLGSSAKLVSGGQTVLKSSAPAVSKSVSPTLIKVGKNAAVATGILGGVTIAGAKIYDYVGDQWAVTTVQRENENTLNLMDKENKTTKQAQDNQLAYLKGLAELRNSGVDSSTLGASGGAGDSLFPVSTSGGDQTATASSDTLWYVLAGITILGIGAYTYTHRGKK